MSLLNKTVLDTPFEIEEIKISKNRLRLKINVITGKEGEFWVCIAPSINTSGYGKTRLEAEESFDVNAEIFKESLFELRLEERIIELKNLGWNQKPYLKRQMSKAFVDTDGILQNLKNVTFSSLESAA